MTEALSPGNIVRCRNREWVLLPPDEPGVYLLRPLTGATDETVAVHEGLLKLIGNTLPGESIKSAAFPLPTPDQVADAAGARLLRQAARLALRDGASPFRSLGRISIRPRVYQFVPLLMALRLDPVRILIADDVGVGKTIEALLIAREMLDSGDIKRFCVLCPPHLCDTWKRDMELKFNLEVAVVRSGTISSLERKKTTSESIYKAFPVFIASIDFLKSERNRHTFLQDCPDLVIVDEAHGSAQAEDAGQQQRHDLLREISANRKRHLLLLTATPHSGVESAFRSLLALLNPEFGDWNMAELSEPRRVELARHYVQRTRADILRDWEGEHCFPRREPVDRTHRLSPAYRALFDKAYEFCHQAVEEGKNLGRIKQRARFWAVLSLLRCIMSSPAAAVAALESRRVSLESTEEEEDVANLRGHLFETIDDIDDEAPPAEEAVDSGMKRLKVLASDAGNLLKSNEDFKAVECVKLVGDLLKEGLNPIVWCRYIATAEYLAERLDDALRNKFAGIRVLALTGRLGDEERKAKIAELPLDKPRVLVATDCLSEGVNLQDQFSAVVHYDLPWNPNRLEQREGRVDRFGQPAPVVKAIRFYSPDNPVDGVVIDVLLNKAREIHKALGTHVPVPDESETVTEALLNALFLRGPRKLEQRTFDFGDSPVDELHKKWDRDAEREKTNRTRFAQRALKPEEVKKELESADEVLGDPVAVRHFVLDAAQRLRLSVKPDRKANVYILDSSGVELPQALRLALPEKDEPWRISFDSPTPEGAEYIGRNHAFTAALARHLLEDALDHPDKSIAARCGVIRTKAVKRLTTIWLLRARYLLEEPDRPNPLLAEEVLVAGRTGERDWLPPSESLALLDAVPAENIPMNEKKELITLALKSWKADQAALRDRLKSRGAELEESHKRIRKAVSLKVRELKVVPQYPPDALGILILQPLAGG